MSTQKENVKSVIYNSLKVIHMFDWLLDLYVLDYFVDNHWEKLSPSWRCSFDNIALEDLGNVISGKAADHMFPLSFLALVKVVQTLSIQRQSSLHPHDVLELDKSQQKLKNLFLKHVKLKKRHEISLMANVVRDTALKSECEAVIDFGSGLGHLVRMLGYRHNLSAAGIERQSQLTEEASKLDLELEYTASKHNITTQYMTKHKRPLHFNITLTSHNQICELPLPDNMKCYGLIGLHPCGDLGPLLLRHFVECDNVKFICVVGCCFMKLTCDGTGYPMSGYVQGLDSRLSYASREIACHAIEVYCDRLKKGNYEDLKVHAYRAALERVLVGHDPSLKHSPVRSIKHTNALTIEKYFALALERIDAPITPTEATWAVVARDIARWRQVVCVYTLRLLLAPLVENVILLDRVLYVLEHGYKCQIHPVFDPRISPRNHIITARK